MIHSVRFTAVLDTNVIYPVIIRDLLLWFAHYDLYTPRWSSHIFDEWKQVMIRMGVSEEEAERRAQAPDRAFPDAFVKHYEGIISIQAFREMVLNKKNPKLDEYAVLEQLRKSGLADTANYLHALL